MNNRQDVPADGIGTQKMSEKPSDVAKAVGLVAVDGLIVLGEGLFELVRPESIESSKPLANETVEFEVCALLGAAFNDHRR